LKVYLFEFWGSFCGEVRNGNFLQFYPSRNMKKMNLHESVSVKIGFVVCSREVSEIGVTNLKRKKNTRESNISPICLHWGDRFEFWRAGRVTSLTSDTHQFAIFRKHNWSPYTVMNIMFILSSPACGC